MEFGQLLQLLELMHQLCLLLHRTLTHSNKNAVPYCELVAALVEQELGNTVDAQMHAGAKVGRLRPHLHLTKIKPSTR